ncbi:acetylornithine deacetylase [Gorillibacterium sp. sgz5001074]|uniref:acetylornithine deacetylase n=1 Tax=Gorillibacterium sp. sgz5001074 TaxID=3446695 RepID=UPI003F66B760
MRVDSELKRRIEWAADQAANRQEELLALLDRLVSYPTVSPPARNTALAQREMTGRLEELGFRVEAWELYAGDPIVVGTRKGSDSSRYRSLILNGHMDVAEVGDPREWTKDPFRITVEDGWAYGRGTADMKGAMAAALFALQLLKEAGVELGGDLQFHSVTGEEAGEAGTRSVTEKGCTEGYDYALVMDTSSMAIQGQGGVITGWVTVRSPVTHHDGMRSRMIHAGGRTFGASAIEKMMRLVAALQDLERHWAVMKAYPGFPPGSNTINPAVIEGGRHAAFIADECSLWITVHFYPDEEYATVTREIEEHLNRAAMADPWLREHPPEFRWGGRSMIEERGEIFPSLELDPSHPGFSALAASHRKVLGTGPEVGMSPSVTDAGWIGRTGVPTAIYGPGQLAHAHAVDERVQVEELVRYVQVLVRFIAEWCNTPKAGV